MRKRLRSHEGANAVEFALVLPILLMLIFGGITAGLTLNTKQQMDHATREGARYAATLPFGIDACNGTDPWQDCVSDRVMATAVGSVNLSDGGVCITHIAEDGTTNSYFYGSNITTDGGTTNPGDKCVSEDVTLDGARVQVKTVSPGRVDAIFVGTGAFNLTSRSISRYEAD